MAAIYILSGYQNYFNRQIKEPKELVAAYPQDLISYYDTGNVTQVINFNPADGVIAHHTVGRPENPYDGSGDYFLYTEDGVNVTSRWFIIESTRTRQGQYNVTLKRDVIADNYNKVLNSDCFIQKATVNDDSALIYNQEAITTNQIKTSETPLKDESKMAWIVGFVNREAPAKTITINSSVVPDIKVDSLTNWDFNQYVDKGVVDDLYPVVRAYIRPFTSRDYQKATFIETKVSISNDSTSTPSNYYYTGGNSAFESYLNGYRNLIREKARTSAEDYFTNLPTYITPSNWNAILDLKGKILQVGTESTGYNFYKIDYEVSEYYQTVDIKEDKGSSDLYTYLNSVFKGYSGYSSGTPIYDESIRQTVLTLKITPVVEGEYTIDYPAKTGHLINKSAPFDVFCIPFADDMKIRVGSSEVQANKQFAMSIASELGRNLTGDCYDIQLLPFCPMTGYTVTDNIFDINSSDEKRRTAIKKGDTIVYWMFWSTASSGTFNIHLPILAGNKKLANQCDMYRLVSPNYSGQFEFNLAKNGGYVEYFNVDYTYLPISSYIHVNPDFKGLYGSDFNDARGLICQGDFSIMYLSDPWKNYQRQNKNFEQIFSREISNMDVNRKYQRMGETISAWTGAIGAGGGIGGLIGGIAGGIAGGVAGAASLAAGYADRSISDKLYQESVSFKKDMHEMQLENIKALPNSIAKTTAYNENNKIFPILEYYTCTDEEKDLVASAIANMGMTVNAVGKPIDYVYNNWSYNGIFSKGFFKATLIRLEDLPEDYHMLQAIAEELSLGIYFKGE